MGLVSRSKQIVPRMREHFGRIKDNLTIIIVFIAGMVSTVSMFMFVADSLLANTFNPDLLPARAFYSVPLIVFLSLFPTLIYTDNLFPPPPFFDMTVRGAVHAVSTIGIVLLCLLFLGSINNIFLVITVIFSYFVGRVVAIFLLKSFVTSLKKAITLEYELSQKETEQASLKLYTDELERQQTAMRKFGHDYQNLLLPIEALAKADDLTALKQYCLSIVSTASDSLSGNILTLDGLGKIEVTAVKSIIAAKLTYAQSLDISVSFEADDVIDNIPVDLSVLVRQLGILIDNATEALLDLDGGKLSVGCFMSDKAITFLIQNTCPPDMPKLQKIWKPGFSTKGKGRGFGMSNLQELADSTPNVTVDIHLENGNFLAMLIVHLDK